MGRTHCIFCNEKLNGSREHIIPDCINGRITSNQIICSSCNKLFSQNIDKEIRIQLNPILFMMGFKNSNQVQFISNDNKKYLLNRKFGLQPIKPEIVLREKNKRKGVTITGMPEHIDGVLKKMNKLLATKIKGAKFVATKERENLGAIPLARAPLNLEINKNVKCLFNKIALEFLALNNSALDDVSHLLPKVHDLADDLNNVFFSNFRNEVRDFEPTEISHLILIIGDGMEKKLYAYIELFNIYCGVVTLSNSYSGRNIKYSYYQDAITGETLDSEIKLKTLPCDLVPQNLDDNALSRLSSLLAERQRERYLNDAVKINLNDLMKNLNDASQQGLIKDEEFKELYLKGAANIVGQLAFQIPYSIEIEEGQPPHENEQYNFYHSNFKSEKVDEFIEINKQLLNLRIVINEEMYQVESFYKEDFVVNIDNKLVKLYVVLQSVESKQKSYIPIKEMLGLLKNAKQLDSVELEKYESSEI